MNLFDTTPMRGTAVISDCGRYRYSLTRRWSEDGPTCVWLMLNPSTADAEQDDPTIRRCIGYSRKWCFAGLTVLNLFALRATDPGELGMAEDPVGPGNDAALRELTKGRTVICAWGNHGRHLGRSRYVVETLLAGADLRYLKLTLAGEPNHPLYLPGDLCPVSWKQPPARSGRGDRTCELRSAETPNGRARS